ncbi:hypothetical protein HKI87_08g55570 [Chloropicon roscoffensis]|uniref:Uncharacterized protein n=1 Tax=Chloropicon roscoffensis TaxID=1461544 RepID=A0AAX4PDQ2_9CHLO
MVEQKKGRGANRGTEPASVKALGDEVEGLKLSNAKVEAECQTPQEEKKEVKLPTEGWVIVAGKINQNDVCSFALVSKQLREAQVLAGRKLVTRTKGERTEYGDEKIYFSEGWCAYWSKKFDVPWPGKRTAKVIREILYIAASYGYLQVFEKYWSQGPQEKLSKLWDEDTCHCAASDGHLEVLQWLRAKGCPWGSDTSINAARGGHLEMLQWMRAQKPPCPWNSQVCFLAAWEGHLDLLRWAKSMGCPWDEAAPYFAATRGHLEVLIWLIKEGYPYDKSMCRRAAVVGGKRARKVLEWIDKYKFKF